MSHEDLVPPLELCKQIPKGSFEDSALVWHIRLCSLEPAHVSQRFSPAICAAIYPAPTLAEIMEEIQRFEPVSFTLWRTGQVVITCQREGSEIELVSHDTPATAALKLWMEIREEAGR